MLSISFSADVRGISRKLTDLARKQLPFATAQALTAVARDVQKMERDNLELVLDRPTPFTKSAIRVIPARKGKLFALVVMQDITAAYLAPYEFGGLHKLIGKGITWFNPKNIALNQYGNIPQNAIVKLLGGNVTRRFKGQLRTKTYAPKAGYFAGPLKNQGGKRVSGIWQRLPGRRLRLIAAFGDAHPPNVHLDWFKKAEREARARFPKAFGAALGRAIATAKP